MANNETIQDVNNNTNVTTSKSWEWPFHERDNVTEEVKEENHPYDDEIDSTIRGTSNKSMKQMGSGHGIDALSSIIRGSNHIPDRTDIIDDSIISESRNDDVINNTVVANDDVSTCDYNTENYSQHTDNDDNDNNDGTTKINFDMKTTNSSFERRTGEVTTNDSSIYSKEDETWNLDFDTTNISNNKAVAAPTSSRIFETVSGIYSSPDPTWNDNHTISMLSSTCIENNNNTKEITTKTHDESDDGPHTSSYIPSSRQRWRIRKQQKHHQQQQQHRQQATVLQQNNTIIFVDDNRSIASESVHRIAAAAESTRTKISKLGISLEQQQQQEQKDEQDGSTLSEILASVEQYQTNTDKNNNDFNNDNVPPLPYDRPHTYTHRMIKYHPIILSSPFSWAGGRKSTVNRGSVLLDETNNNKIQQQQQQQQDDTYFSSLSSTIKRIGTILLCCGSSSIMIYCVSLSFITVLLLAALTKKAELPEIEVAMIGNSMMYYNDLPRFLGK
jgi:hypothetical protein